MNEQNRPNEPNEKNIETSIESVEMMFQRCTEIGAGLEDTLKPTASTRPD